MNDDEIDVEVDLEAIHSKRRRDLFENDEFLQTDRNIPKSEDDEEADQTRFDSDKIRNPIEELLKHSNTRTDSGSLSNYRLYHYWKGNNNFCLDGKFLNGLKQRSLKSRVTLLLIVLSFCIYLIFPAFYLYDKISPFITLLTIYTFILTIFFYFMTFRYFSLTSSDPGIIPKRPFLQLKRLRITHRVLGKEKLIFDHHRQLCKTCKIRRPERSSHCR